MEAAHKKQETVVIKKYANRRLYDTETSAYITLEDLCERVKEGREFVVLDAKTNQNLTNQVLTQIILEQEIKGAHLLPTEFLRSAIRFYDNKMGNVLQHYLDASMKSFIHNQDRVSQIFGKVGENAGSPFGQIEEMTRSNVAQGVQLFEKTMQMFNPFGAIYTGKAEEELQEEVAPKKKRAKR
jgi:polyhydroxyalkanoate synthesis repressor PhaR